MENRDKLNEKDEGNQNLNSVGEDGGDVIDYDKAAAFWEEKSVGTVPVPRQQLLAEAENFIRTHNTCALAAGCDDFIRCTPIEYIYWDGRFWLMSEGGMKFRALRRNKKVCLAIYDSFSNFYALGGMQVTGTAQVIEPWSEEYRKLLEVKNISEEKLRNLPHPMYMIKITPVQVEFLWSGFEKMGYNLRQTILF